MIEVFYIGQGDQFPYYPIQVRDQNGPVDLSALGVMAGQFYLKNISTGSIIVSGAAVAITDMANGEAEYRWAVADTGALGEYEASFKFTTADGNFTLPRGQVAKVVVETNI